LLFPNGPPDQAFAGTLGINTNAMKTPNPFFMNTNLLISTSQPFEPSLGLLASQK